jgi:hypothetical protein
MKRATKEIIGLIVLVVGVLLAVYLGVWVMCIGGIVQLLEALKASPINAMGFACGLVRFLLARAVGWTTAMASIGLAKLISD